MQLRPSCRFWFRSLLAWLHSRPRSGRRDGEPNSVYADRLASSPHKSNAHRSLGLTGREDRRNLHFEQEENFYYLTVKMKEGAGLIILPRRKSSTNDASGSPLEFFYLPAKKSLKEKMECARMSPTDPGIEHAPDFQP